MPSKTFWPLKTAGVQAWICVSPESVCTPIIHPFIIPSYIHRKMLTLIAFRPICPDRLEFGFFFYPCCSFYLKWVVKRLEIDRARFFKCLYSQNKSTWDRLLLLCVLLKKKQKLSLSLWIVNGRFFLGFCCFLVRTSLEKRFFLLNGILLVKQRLNKWKCIQR